jgi:TIR domain
VATVAEYYKTDFSLPVWLEAEWDVAVDSKKYVLEATILPDFAANAKYLAIYFGSEITDSQILLDVLAESDTFLQKPDKIILGRTTRVGATGKVERLGNNEVRLVFRAPGDVREIDDKSLQFTGRIYFYTENRLSPELVQRLEYIAQSKGLSLLCRGPEYAAERDRLEKPRAFISHDSRDKETIARKIAATLRTMRCPVWFDEFSLIVGDSLRESIETGLKTCHKCVFILTPNFLSKGGWPKREYDAIFTRELVEDRKLILPVWAGVSREEVYEYSPTLADRVALHWEEGREEEVCRKLLSKLVAST